MTDTIFALSSGAPPAAIGVIRISGPAAGTTLESMVGRDIPARKASLARLHAVDGTVLDEALVLWFPGPKTATGEDLLELHCHGGRAVVAAIESELSSFKGLRKAEPGEFTRRAFANGRIDLAEAEGLADLLSAETELQRSAAMAMAGGGLSRQVEEWRDALLRLAAEVEAALDFSDEADVGGLADDFSARVQLLSDQLDDFLQRPRSERLSEGFRVVLAGPPNTGKSTLFNALVESEAAITSPIAGTTRDVIERSVAISGVPFTFVDTAGLHDGGDDAIEAIGIDRARSQLKSADLVLWLGPDHEEPNGAWGIEAQVDNPTYLVKSAPMFRVSALTGEGVGELKSGLLELARNTLPKPGEAALNARQHNLLQDSHGALLEAHDSTDPLLIAESLRRARLAFDRLIGRATTEDMLDALFGRFCIGK
jgi:tRNA modification GTPase